MEPERTKLSVNINKFATLRNARGGNNPDILKAAVDCQLFGADGITVHPRPDERHIRYQDARDIKKVITTEYNIEGNPVQSFIALVLEIKPDQVTLVPDAPDVITSNAGWDCKKNLSFLREVIKEFKRSGIRVSVFLDPDPAQVEWAAKTGTDRIELYTENYAVHYSSNRESAIAAYVKTAELARKEGLGVNAGHDLDLKNLRYFIEKIPFTSEVSIGHALICDAIYLGLENVIPMYKLKATLPPGL